MVDCFEKEIQSKDIEQSYQSATVDGNEYKIKVLNILCYNKINGERTESYNQHMFNDDQNLY